MRSRVDSTRVIGQAIARASNPPRLWLQASTATIYAHRYDAANDEASGIIGGNEKNSLGTWHFSVEVAKAWERAFNEASLPQTRKVLLRSALTVSPDGGGFFDILLGLVRHGLGGRMGNGRQFVSWIHDVDFVAAISWLIESATPSSRGERVARNGSTPTRKRLRFAGATGAFAGLRDGTAGAGVG